MKRLSFVLACIFLAQQLVNAQCQPKAPTGQAGLSPETDSLPCVVRGEYYSEVFYLENFDTVHISALTITVDTLHVDSIINGPCNLKWMANDGTNEWHPGESGCIRIYGTTNDTVGQYKLKIYITAYTNVLGKFSGEVSDIVTRLETLLGQPLYIDFNYWIRVRESSDPCVPVNRNDTTLNLTANLNCALPGAFSASISAPDHICIGDSFTLNSTVTGATTPLYHWIADGGLNDTTASDPVVTPNSSGFYTLIVTDSATGAETYARTFVKVSQNLPVADFAAQANGLRVGFIADTADVLTYTWDFGDGTSTATTKSIIHTYANDGTYEVTLTVNNICGTSTKTDSVTVTGTGIDESQLLGQVKLWPNPAVDVLQVELPTALAAMQPTLTVFDLQGRAVQQTTLGNASGVTAVSLNELLPGMYFVSIQTNNSTEIRKLLIQ